MILSLVFTFFVLVLTSFNIIIAIFSVFSIGAVLSSILAIIYLMGWSLGVSESIAMVIFVGLSQDYIVHLGHMYIENIYDSKQKRMDFSLKSIGLTVISSGLTSYSSGVFLVFCNIYMLYKFGILIQISIILALFYSIIFFSALNYLMGPQNKSGDLIYWVWKPLRNKIMNCFA